VAGYADSTKAHANYPDSSTGQYSDAEAVRITYDPSRISYADLLRIYFSVAHNPTEIDRQGPDTGPQYRSEIFAANTAQARVARAYIRQIKKAGVFDAPIATQVTLHKALATQHKSFYPAEAYHQNYALRHPDSLYIRTYDAPKVAALKARFAQRYRA
jgi:peptide-methionine (S)-S-oxide reductase